MMRSRNGTALIHALLLFHFVTLGGICDDGRSICDLVPSFEQDVTGGYTIRLSTYESKWDTLTAVVSLSGIQWLSIPMALQWESRVLRWRHDREYRSRDDELYADIYARTSSAY